MRSILFAKDVRALVTLHEQQGTILLFRFKHVTENTIAVPSSSWKLQSEILYHTLTMHISETLSEAAGPLLALDHVGRISIHSSVIICLTAKVELCRLLAQHSISSEVPEMDWELECELTLGAVVNMTSQLTDADLCMADPFLIVRPGVNSVLIPWLIGIVILDVVGFRCSSPE